MPQDTTNNGEEARVPDAVARNYGAAWMSNNPTADASTFPIELLIGIIKRQWLLIGTISIVLAIPLLTYVMLLEKRYSATALVAVDISSSELIQSSTRRPSPDTEVEIMRSFNIVNELGKRLAAEPDGEQIFQNIRPLDKNSENSERPSSGVLFALRKRFNQVFQDSRPPIENSENGKRPSSRDLLALRNRFNIRRRGLTDVIAIEAWAKTPELAARFANLYAKTYLDAQVEQRIRSIERIDSILSLIMGKIKLQIDVPGAPIALRQLHHEYLAQLKKVRRAGSAVVPYMRIAAKALPMDRPSFPPRFLLLVLAATIAVFVATTIAFARDWYYR